MVWYDFLMLAILAYGVWQGAARGLVMQLAWIVALILCFKFADKLAPSIEPMISVEPPLRHWIAMFILYLGFSLISFMVARTFNSAIEKAKFKDFDRHLGGLFGLIKGFIFSLVLTFFAVTLSESLRETVLSSQTGRVACTILDTIEPLTPEDFHPLLQESLEKYRDSLQPIHDQPGHPASLQDLLVDIVGGSDGESTEQGSGSDEDHDHALSDRPEGHISSRERNGPSYQDLLQVLPRSFRGQIGSSLENEWNDATIADRQQLIRELERAWPDEVRDLLNRVLVRSSGREGVPLDSDLVHQITEAYRDPDAIELGIRRLLADVPERIQWAVLRDWHADLTMDTRDPDRSTDIYTRLDERILNQLHQAGVSLQQVSFELRDRLQQSLR